MKKTVIAAMLGTMALSLAACGGKGDDKLGHEVEKAYDNRADAIEQAADNMKDQAKQLRKSGEQQADAIDDADVNAQAMTEGQKDALKNGTEKLR
ncbi:MULTISPECIES: hypothetical protein [unclassified Sphingomonas]|jgi:predicted glycosyltransferase|uniref:hypothetical protein n=1 Tax=unclassified Sphingomonas TaxID=196159 RepID=UPI000E102ADB|nr:MULTISPECIES: hypothetical protein [unclassified Sphingomonas]AXJ94690.1 hypothetical protein DM480_03430 [Sphingomonas sp. FARSPH]